MTGMIPKALNSASFGYALLLTINAISIWGGVFPFLPIEFQTPRVTISFYLAQSAAFCSSFFAAMASAYYRPDLTRRVLSFTSAVPIFVGSLLLIAAMYAKALTMLLVVTGGILMGVGCSGFLLLWQRFFASQDSDRCNMLLITGTGLATFLYFGLYLVPGAVTAFLVPLVFVPLCGLALTINMKDVDFAQPMFEDMPSGHPVVYSKLTSDLREDVLCVAALGLASGVMRAIAIAEPSVGAVVNNASMMGALVASIALMMLWRKLTFHFDIALSFRIIFPVTVIGFTLLPFLEEWFLVSFAAVTHMVFTFITMLMTVQCAQLSRDRGTNPVFVFGFYSGIVYLMQSVGFVTGFYSSDLSHFGFEQLSIMALVTVSILALILLYLSWSASSKLTELQADRHIKIEFIALSSTSSRQAARAANEDASPGDVEKPRVPDAVSPNSILDRTSKKCLGLQKRYRLSDRETEVMELVARGNSVTRIAEMLSVSENTVRTHKKHIYVKLDIHKRQELLDRLDEVSLDG